MTFTKTISIKPGDEVKISLPAGYSVEGKVISAFHWGERDGWYIELNKYLNTERNRNLDLTQTSYGYWKQGRDGGTVEKL